jgi:hypothetical protein
MFCSVCKSEYREGFTRCTDCDVPLVNSLSAEAEPLDHAALANFWQGSDPRVAAEICSELDRQRIPYRLQHADSRFLGLTNQPETAIYIPRAMVDQARANFRGIPEVDEEAEFQAEENASDGNDPEDSSPETETEKDDLQTNTAENWDHDDWNPGDATQKVWDDPQGDTTSTGMIIASLQENHIHWRANGSDDPDDDADAPITEIYVMPENEARAREIIREVTEASPPA